MKNWKWKKSVGGDIRQQNKTAFLGGSYSLIVTVIVLAYLDCHQCICLRPASPL